MPNNATLSFDTATAESAAADESLWTLYADAMPADEREPRAVILASIAAGEALLTRAKRGASETVGFAVVHLLKRPPAAFLVYLAVARQERGGGIGGGIFEYSWSTAKRVAAGRGVDLEGMIWEIDDPELAPNDAERQRRIRRRAFFTGLGGTALPVAYLQPPVNGPAAVPMLLMWRARPGAVVPPVAELVRAIYFEKYGAANGLPAEMLERLINRVFAT